MILDRRGSSFWEVALVRGALWYHGVESVVAGVPPELEPVSAGGDLSATGAGLAVLLPAPGEDTRQLSEWLRSAGAQGVILAGHGRTRTELGWSGQSDIVSPPAPLEHEVVVVGEPYAAVARLATDEPFLRDALGKTLVGPLLDPARYRTAVPAGGGSLLGHRIPLLTSLGCEKRCGYCAMAPAYVRLYPRGVPRRPRPWPGLLAELTVFHRAGAEGFRFLADQFLSTDPSENEQLQALTQAWRASASNTPGDRPRVVFTVGPAEVVRNKPLLKDMAEVFDLEPRLSLDSLDDETLRFLDLESRAATALEAAAFLASLGVPWRANYIFVRPGMTPKALRGELQTLVELAGMTGHFDLGRKLLLAIDIFSRRLDVLEGSPVAEKGVPQDYEKDLPADVLRAAVAIRSAIERFIDSDPGLHPLVAAAEAGLSILEEGRPGP